MKISKQLCFDKCNYYGVYMSKLKILFITAFLSTIFFSFIAKAEVSEETAYILNSFLFLVCGFLVMWMAAGFCMLESGLVTSCLLYTSPSPRDRG